MVMESFRCPKGSKTVNQAKLITSALFNLQIAILRSTINDQELVVQRLKKTVKVSQD